jgi:hypothetical protein
MVVCKWIRETDGRTERKIPLLTGFHELYEQRDLTGQAGSLVRCRDDKGWTRLDTIWASSIHLPSSHNFPIIRTDVRKFCLFPPAAYDNTLHLHNRSVWSALRRCMIGAWRFLITSSLVKKSISKWICFFQSKLRDQPIVTCINLPTLDSRFWRSHKNRIIQPAAHRAYLWHSGDKPPPAHTHCNGAQGKGSVARQINVQQ